MPLDLEDQEIQATSRARAMESMEKLMAEHVEGAEAEETDEQETPQKAAEDESATPPLPDDQNDSSATTDGEKPPVEAEPKPDGPVKLEGEPEPKPAEPAQEEDEVLKRIDSVNLRDTAHPKTKKAIKTVKEIAKEERKARLIAEQALKDKDAEIERQKSLKLLDPETEKEITELRTFRRTFDTENDPNFNRPFEERQADLENQAMTVLRKNNIPESTAAFITKAGGALKFRSSQQLMPRGLKDSDGNLVAQHPDGTPFTFQEFWEDAIIPAVAAPDKDDLTSIALESRAEARKRDVAIQDLRKNADQIFKDREEQAKKQREEWGAQSKAAAEETIKELGEVAQLKTVPNNATAEEKAEIEKHNARYNRAQGIAQRLASEITPKNVTRMAIINAYHETAFKDQMKDKDDRIAELEKQVADKDKWINDVKNAGKTSNKGSTTAPTGAKPAPAISEDPETRMARMQDEYLKEHQPK